MTSTSGVTLPKNQEEPDKFGALAGSEQETHQTHAEEVLKNAHSRKAFSPLPDQLGTGLHHVSDAATGETAPDSCRVDTLCRASGAPSNPESAKDNLSLTCIWRANLDSCWSQSSKTVMGHVGQIQMKTAMADLLAPDPLFPLRRLFLLSITVAVEWQLSCLQSP